MVKPSAAELVAKLWSLKQDHTWVIIAAYLLDGHEEVHEQVLQASKEEAIQIVLDIWYKEGPLAPPGSYLHTKWHTRAGSLLPTNSQDSQQRRSQQESQTAGTHHIGPYESHGSLSTSAGTRASTSKNTTGEPDALFVCPITQELMSDPVVAADGILYEREAIEKWLCAHNTSPMTNLPLPHKLLTPCYGLRSSIQEYRTAHGL